MRLEESEMKRADQSRKVRWRKVGGGSFRMANGKIIKPNQVFSAAPEEIPKGFRDVIVSLEDIPAEQMDLPVEPKVPVEELYTVRSRGIGWYDVVNTQTDKAMNERALRAAEAEALFKELTA